MDEPMSYADFKRLIERSSLGSPHARALRKRKSQAKAQRTVNRARAVLNAKEDEE